ncbi:hypothetical protein Poli38472_001933 [Pythium oligandrum]|uniref:Uncharacterized protein n=1 Tax=Pythium oligandrum TaxID=41045 RepID=A0A8K1CVP3_PYTOL|nr:hypothetical protein Poli38472_001933 [Pythium oligandrum]|eukprot:TMW69777.1 hypothetical protein Poli38472_001933 [Pythium oligandrum]
MAAVFLAAARDGDVDMLQRCLNEDNAVLLVYDENENTALHLVASAGHLDALRLLLDNDVGNTCIEMTNSTMKTALLCACSSQSAQSVEIVRELLGRGANLNAVDNCSRTALACACLEGTTEVVKELVTRDLDLDSVDKYHTTALHYAAGIGNLPMVKTLLDAGASINAKGAGPATAVHQAAVYNDVEVAELLLKSGIDPNARDPWSRTALMHGIGKERYLDFARLLIVHGVDVNAIDINQETALHKASKLVDGLDIVKFLLKHGADPLCPQRDGSIVIVAADRGHLDIVDVLMDYIDDSAFSPHQFQLLLAHACRNCDQNFRVALKLLHRGENIVLENYAGLLNEAVLSGNAQVVAYILELGTKAAVPDMSQTLDSALFHVKTLDVLNLLVERGASIHTTEGGCNVLHSVCMKGTADMVEMLLDKGIDPNGTTSLGDSSFQMAAANPKRDDIVTLLIARGFNVNRVDPVTQMSPLLQACAKGNVYATTFLLDHGADATTTTMDGCTGLHLACYKGAFWMVELFCKRGFDINAQNVNGWTPLHIAANVGDTQLISSLIEFGANTEALDQDGKTPLSICMQWEWGTNPLRRRQTIYELMSHGAAYVSSPEHSTKVFFDENGEEGTELVHCVDNSYVVGRSKLATIVLLHIQLWTAEQQRGKKPLTQIDLSELKCDVKAVERFVLQAIGK